LNVFGDINWARDLETRISVTGLIVPLMNLPICLRSKAQRDVALSRREAGYVVIFEAFKEIKFMYFIYCVIGVDVEPLIVIKNNNISVRKSSRVKKEEWKKKIKD
jgi:hypothetical protein